MSVWLAWLEAPQIKQQQGELVIVQDVLVIEGELQDILGTVSKGGDLRRGRGQASGRRPPPPQPSPHLHGTMDPVVEGLVPLGVAAVGHHPGPGGAGGCRGQP